MPSTKLVSLKKYADQVKDRLNSDVPTKWAHAPVEYKAYLARELKITLAKLEDLSLSSEGKK